MTQTHSNDHGTSHMVSSDSDLDWWQTDTDSQGKQSFNCSMYDININIITHFIVTHATGKAFKTDVYADV